MKCGHCDKEGPEVTVAHVRECAVTPATPLRSRPATENQRNYAHGLLREREPFGIVQDVELTNSLEAAHEYINGMDFSSIRDFIGAMKEQPRRGTKSRTVEVLVDEGMYRRDGGIFKVQHAVHGSGHLYAKRLTENGFTYAPGMLSALRPEDKMTLEEAKEYGTLYGMCCVCGRTLTDEDSIAAGIGPICGNKEGWFA